MLGGECGTRRKGWAFRREQSFVIYRNDPGRTDNMSRSHEAETQLEMELVYRRCTLEDTLRKPEADNHKIK